MMTIQQRYHTILQRIKKAAIAAGRDPSDITLLLVSKQATSDQIQVLIDLGQVQFGENRLPHLNDMVASLSSDQPLSWHFIGHVQRKKVAKIIQHCSWVQSLDSVALADKLQKEAAIQKRMVQVLVQVNISGETQKTGVSPEDVSALVTHVASLSNVQCRGLMCMAPHTDQPEMSRPVFEACRVLFEDLQKDSITDAQFDTLSMGMSNDFEMAIACGATMVRIGSLVIT